MKRVILCVDDFGLKPEVNEAVAELVDAGVVSATGCMSQGPAWREGAALLKGARRERLDVGLHFNLTEAFEGAYNLPLPRLMALALLRALSPAKLQHAVCSQLDAFEDVWGQAPDFVDGHQHVHQFPQVRDVLLDELERRYGRSAAGGPPHRPWLRLTRARTGPLGVEFKQRVIEALGARGFERKARALGYRLNGALLGVYGFDADPAAFARRLQAWLSQAHDGDVLMMHPASPPHGAGVGGAIADPIARARTIEYTVLRESGSQLMAQEGVQAVRMGGSSGMLTD